MNANGRRSTNSAGRSSAAGSGNRFENQMIKLKGGVEEQETFFDSNLASLIASISEVKMKRNRCEELVESKNPLTITTGFCNISGWTDSRTLLPPKPPSTTKGKFFFGPTKIPQREQTSKVEFGKAKEKENHSRRQRSFELICSPPNNQQVERNRMLSTTGVGVVSGQRNSARSIVCDRSFEEVKQKKSTSSLFVKMGLNDSEVYAKLQHKIRACSPKNGGCDPILNNGSALFSAGRLRGSESKLNMAVCLDNEDEDEEGNSNHGDFNENSFFFSAFKHEYSQQQQQSNQRIHSDFHPVNPSLDTHVRTTFEGQQLHYRITTAAVIRIQTVFRRYRAKKMFVRKKNSAIKIQRLFRNFSEKVKRNQQLHITQAIRKEEVSVLQALKQYVDVAGREMVEHPKNLQVFESYRQIKNEMNDILRIMDGIAAEGMKKLNLIHKQVAKGCEKQVDFLRIQAIAADVQKQKISLSPQMIVNGQDQIETPESEKQRRLLELIKANVNRNIFTQQVLPKSSSDDGKTSGGCVLMKEDAESVGTSSKHQSECKCGAEKIVQLLRLELKQKMELERTKESHTFQEFIRIQDELHTQRVKHRSSMLEISEALKKVEIKLVSDSNLSEIREFDLIKDLQQIHLYVQDKLMYCSPQVAKKNKSFAFATTTVSSDQGTHDSVPAQRGVQRINENPVESRKLIFDSALFAS